MDAQKLARMLPILRCPRTGTALRIEADELVSEAGERYPIINGKPILVRRVQALHITPPDASVVSQNIASYSLPPEIAPRTGFKIHIGSGNVPCANPDVISIDILPNTNVDMVAEAEALPFASDAITYAESGAVFEHLYDPLAAIKEVRRVLAPGGRFYIDTAFMQGYHGFPCHYFNMTPQAVETFIVDDFRLVSSHIPPSGSPAVAVENLLRKFIEALPRDDRERLLSLQTVDLLAELSGNVTQLHGAMSEHMQRSMAASACVVAEKPEAYRHIVTPEAAEARRNYYAARVGVMQRFYEVEHYRGRVLEMDEQATAAEPALPLADLLEMANVRDTLEPSAWQDATDRLYQVDKDLEAVRDGWIRKYLTTNIAPDAVTVLHRVDQQKVEADAAERRRLKEENQALQAVTRDLQTALAATHASTSWRVTAPLRRVMAMFRSNGAAVGDQAAS